MQCVKYNVINIAEYSQIESVLIFFWNKRKNKKKRFKHNDKSYFHSNNLQNDLAFESEPSWVVHVLPIAHQFACIFFSFAIRMQYAR